MTPIGRLTLSTTLVMLAASAASAQDAGDRAQGLVLARQLCSECHAVEPSQRSSPNGMAPRFEAIANTPGMTAIALSAALQTPHRTMPNVMLNADQLRGIVAYILSLRRG
jgi:mono/diheme cytochrome c family protein